MALLGLLLSRLRFFCLSFLSYLPVLRHHRSKNDHLVLHMECINLFRLQQTKLFACQESNKHNKGQQWWNNRVLSALILKAFQMTGETCSVPQHWVPDLCRPPHIDSVNSVKVSSARGKKGRGRSNDVSRRHLEWQQWHQEGTPDSLQEHQVGRCGPGNSPLHLYQQSFIQKCAPVHVCKTVHGRCRGLCVCACVCVCATLD